MNSRLQYSSLVDMEGKASPKFAKPKLCDISGLNYGENVCNQCTRIENYIRMFPDARKRTPRFITNFLGIPTSISTRNFASTSIEPHLHAPLHLTRSSTTSTGRISTNLAQYLQYRRRIAVHICQTRITSRGGSVDRRTIPLPTVPEDFLDISQRQDLRYQRVDILAHAPCPTRSACQCAIVPRWAQFSNPDWPIWPSGMELLNFADYACRIRVVDMHWYDIDLGETAVAGGVEGGKPVAVGESDGGRKELRVWVGNCEYGREGGGRVLG